MNPQAIYNLLTKEYTLKLATTYDDFQQVKKIRKEVFSSKYKMNPEQLKSIGFIYNQDDKQSFIYLIKYNKTNKYVGTVRAFFINQNTPMNKLPMQKDGNVKDIDSFVKKIPIVEISRGALIKDLPYHKSYSRLKLRTILTFGLMIMTRINFFLYHYTNILTFIELPLHYIFKRQNVIFTQIAEPVDSYGIRIPFTIERNKLLKDTEINMGKITRHYLKALCQDPEPFWQFIDANPYLERSDMQLDRICQLFAEYGEDVDLSLLLGEEIKKSMV